MNLLILLLAGSSLINLLFLYIDILPFLKKRFIKVHYLANEPVESFSKKVFNAANKMILSSKTFMTMSERNDFIVQVSLLIKGKKFKEFKKYSYPKAFLYLGLLKYAEFKKDNVNQLKIKNRFDELYINEDGKPTFNIDKVDQTVFAQVALVLLKHTKDKKYKEFTDLFYNYLKSKTSSNGIIQYRENSKVQYVDILGMICPFLIEYGLHFKKDDALNLAYTHMDYWIEKGLDNQSRLPFHCVNRKTEIKIGPTNWGRGIAWYGLGLSSIVANTNNNNNPHFKKFSKELDSLIKTMDLLKNKDSLWGQFPGNPKGNGLYFDASASTSILYLSVLTKHKTDFNKTISSYVNNDGFIDYTSGDTEGINQYSRAYSKSEFSQGMLLMYLSELKKDIIE